MKYVAIATVITLLAGCATGPNCQPGDQACYQWEAARARAAMQMFQGNQQQQQNWYNQQMQFIQSSRPARSTNCTGYWLGNTWHSSCQ